jgi:crossover junction endodeoxyribonuclease RusA
MGGDLVAPVYRFTIPGNPIPWERARSRGGQHFTAPRTRAHKTLVQAHARKARVPKLSGPVKLTATFYRASAHACDVDNLAKTIQDALNGLAYGDDRQIVWLTAVKSIDREHPRTEVELEEVEPVSREAA